MRDDFTTFAGTLDAVWRRLDGAVRRHSGPARYLTFATSGLKGGAEARMIILRTADRASGTLTVHTHSLSHKVAEIAADPTATLLMWDPQVGLQARLRVTARAREGDDTDWARVPSEGRRRNYGNLPPAMPIASPEVTVTSVATRTNFTVITARIERIETLHLGRDMIRRAQFPRSIDFQGRWITP